MPRSRDEIIKDAGPTFAPQPHIVLPPAAVDTTGDTTPAGVLAMFGAASAPTGWLLCDGTAVSRATYATLFGVIGTTYGTGDGSTTFNLPDFRGRVPAGKGTN